MSATESRRAEVSESNIRSSQFDFQIQFDYNIRVKIRKAQSCLHCLNLYNVHDLFKKECFMKVQNLNNSSVKTRKLIKDTFIQMLSEKNEIKNITVSALTKRANISRATFYAHFDDIYGVVEAFEEELTDTFFTNMKLFATDDYEKFFEAIFSFMKENDEIYKMICKSNDFLLLSNRIAVLAINKLLELVNNDKRIKNRDHIELDIRIFFEGSFLEYIKYCRGLSTFTLDDLYAFSLEWYGRFIKERCL